MNYIRIRIITVRGELCSHFENLLTIRACSASVIVKRTCPVGARGIRKEYPSWRATVLLQCHTPSQEVSFLEVVNVLCNKSVIPLGRLADVIREEQTKEAPRRSFLR
jgi:hypothetical protein